MKTVRLAVPTKGDKGMRDVVSDIFARAATFTIIDIADGEVKEVSVEKNAASVLKQGTGPLVARDLNEKGVNFIVSGEIGPGAKTLLEMTGIGMILVAPGVEVKEAVEKVLREFRTAEVYA
ncbi:NifB/NifX family molybdenum-iron cluster-binding protein [Candidatus Bathyarchaeota archaeon]|nr:NifB/NifX family molybdenum-iron cluster-binding protein [Candidatus Bathyarchaeota archaeon]